MRRMKVKCNGNDYVTVRKYGEWMDFYYNVSTTSEKIYLYTRKFSLSIYKFFKNGRTMRQLYSFRKWNEPKLTKLMEYKLFRTIEYVLSEKEEEGKDDFDYMLAYRKYQEEKKEKKEMVR